MTSRKSYAMVFVSTLKLRDSPNSHSQLTRGFEKVIRDGVCFDTEVARTPKLSLTIVRRSTFRLKWGGGRVELLPASKQLRGP